MIHWILGQRICDYKKQIYSDDIIAIESACWFGVQLVRLLRISTNSRRVSAETLDLLVLFVSDVSGFGAGSKSQKRTDCWPESGFDFLLTGRLFIPQKSQARRFLQTFGSFADRLSLTSHCIFRRRIPADRAVVDRWRSCAIVRRWYRRVVTQFKSLKKKLCTVLLRLADGRRDVFRRMFGREQCSFWDALLQSNHTCTTYIIFQPET